MSDVSARRYDLDWLRIAAFGLLIFYHIGMFFVSWDWHVKSAHAGPALHPLMVLTNPWRLALLFLIAGCATRFMLDKMDGGAMAKSRSLRLLPPLVFGMLVIVPPQAYYEIVEKLGYAEGWAAFYGKYIGFYDGWRINSAPLIVPTWNHLWFVAYLWVYTMLVIALRPWLQGDSLRPLARWLERRLGHPPVLLLAPALLLILLRLTLRPLFGETHALVDDWYLHPVYLALFLFGYGIAKSDAVWTAIDRLRWPALVLALGCYGTIVWVMLGGAVPGWLRPVLLAFDQWVWIVMLLGFARRRLNQDGPVRRYLTDAIFPFYILHQTVIVVVGHNLTPLGLPAWQEGTILIAVTVAACFAGYEIVRRVTWLRPLFGLKPQSSRAHALA